MFGLYPCVLHPQDGREVRRCRRGHRWALKQYVEEVTTKVFPEPERYFGIKEEEFVELRRVVEQEQG